jgi:hypothetical protein
MQVIFLPWEFAHWRLITASAINPFFHWYADATIIDPDIIWPSVRSKFSI